MRMMLTQVSSLPRLEEEEVQAHWHSFRHAHVLVIIIMMMMITTTAANT
jgi:hypothetical protein